MTQTTKRKNIKSEAVRHIFIEKESDLEMLVNRMAEVVVINCKSIQVNSQETIKFDFTTDCNNAINSQNIKKLNKLFSKEFPNCKVKVDAEKGLYKVTFTP